VRRVFTRALSVLERLLKRPEQKSDPVRTVSVEELPDTLQANRLYVLGSPPWSAALVCPCGCGEIIHLSLLTHDSPTWRLRLDGQRLPSLAPSVWRTKGCRSHFFLRHGSIVWFTSSDARL
jgi:hypothetical protein